MEIPGKISHAHMLCLFSHASGNLKPCFNSENMSGLASHAYLLYVFRKNTIALILYCLDVAYFGLFVMYFVLLCSSVSFLCQSFRHFKNHHHANIV